CPVGTVESRLSRGREILRRRLVQRGLTPAALGVIFAARSASAGVPSVLTRATLAAAMRFAAGTPISEGLVSKSIRNLVISGERAMAISRVKVATAVLMAAGVLGTGAGVLVGQERGVGPAPPFRGAASAVTDQGKLANGTAPNLVDRATIDALEAR